MTYNVNNFTGNVPEELRDIFEYFYQELLQLELVFQESVSLELRPIHVEPEKKRDGMIVYADGTDWDPGSGEGFYGYENSAWVKL